MLPTIALEQMFLLDKDGSLHHKYGAAHSCLYLIRPDGYVGFRSQPVDLNQVRKFFEKAYLFRPAEAEPTLWTSSCLKDLDIH